MGSMYCIFGIWIDAAWLPERMLESLTANGCRLKDVAIPTNV